MIVDQLDPEASFERLSSYLVCDQIHTNG